MKINNHRSSPNWYFSYAFIPLFSEKMIIDYYEILEIKPSANISEIKTAYRRLAQLYHPDKNPDNKHAANHFALIKEAYEILTTPWKKEKYLQERWLAKINNESTSNPIKTPVDILQDVISAGNHIYEMDIYRMDTERVKTIFLNLLCEYNLDLLIDNDEMDVNDVIVKEMLQLIRVLPPTDELIFLQKITRIPNSCTNAIAERENELANKIFWETWRPAFIILIVIFLCILIWGTSIKN